MVVNQMFNGLCGWLFVKFDVFYEQVQFDCVLVYGDISIVMIVVLVVFYWCILVGYVEVGLCIGNFDQFWFEEMNCCVIDVVVDYLFVFIVSFCYNLEQENFGGCIIIIGNIVIDVLEQIVDCIDCDVLLCVGLDVVFLFFILGCKLLLVIGYCCESFGDGFVNICCVLVELVCCLDLEIVYLVYFNLNVQGLVYQYFGGLDNVYLILLQDYLYFVCLMQCVYVVFIDLGGVQEEVLVFGCLVLVMCDVIECFEVVQVGVVKLVGIDVVCIVVEVGVVCDVVLIFVWFCFDVSFYGDGCVFVCIVVVLCGVFFDEFVFGCVVDVLFIFFLIEVIL